MAAPRVDVPNKDSEVAGGEADTAIALAPGGARRHPA